MVFPTPTRIMLSPGLDLDVISFCAGSADRCANSLRNISAGLSFKLQRCVNSYYEAYRSRFLDQLLYRKTRFPNISSGTLCSDNPNPSTLKINIVDHCVFDQLVSLSPSRDLAYNQGSDSIAYRFGFCESIDCCTVGFGLLHYHWKSHLKLCKGHYSPGLLCKEVEVADKSEHAV